jgi:predicted XRE-type DNA-binding protein
VSDLVRGKIDRFGVDNLIELLGRAGVEITFSAIRRKRRVA